MKLTVELQAYLMQYSPNGKFEYAVHTETLTTPYQTVGANTGSSCAFA